MTGVETKGQTQAPLTQLQGQVLLLGQQRLPVPHLGCSLGKKALKRILKTAFVKSNLPQGEKSGFAIIFRRTGGGGQAGNKPSGPTREMRSFPEDLVLSALIQQNLLHSSLPGTVGTNGYEHM